MRLAFVVSIAVIAGCTAIRPLDPIDIDAARVDAGMDAAVLVDGGTDAIVSNDAGHDVGADTSTDAWMPDAWDGDANCPPEVCGGGDEDCDGMVDEADAVGAMAYYLDMDLDNFGTDASLVMSCVPPANTGSGRWVNRGGDCDDTNRQISPNRSDVTCNGIDDDCNGTVDDSSVMCGSLFGCIIRHYMGHAYAFCAATRSQSDAATQCASIGYHLVNIGDAGENDFVSMNLTGSVGNNGAWIGLMQGAGGAAYTWTDGSAATFVDWDTGEPSLTGPCVRIRSTGRWGDYVCGQSAAYVCEAP